MHLCVRLTFVLPDHVWQDIVGVIADLIDVKTVNPPDRMTVRLRDNRYSNLLILHTYIHTHTHTHTHILQLQPERVKSHYYENSSNDPWNQLQINPLFQSYSSNDYSFLRLWCFNFYVRNTKLLVYDTRVSQLKRLSFFLCA